MKDVDIVLRIVAVLLLVSCCGTTAEVGVWMTGAELALLPTSGSAYDGVITAAATDVGIVDLADQTSNAGVYALAKALVWRREHAGDFLHSHYLQARAAVEAVATIESENGGRTLALGRELIGFVLTADILDLEANNVTLHEMFSTRLAILMRKELDGRTLVSTQEDRPNNWGAHAAASRAAAAAYLRNCTELQEAFTLEAALSSRALYSSFKYGPLYYQCDESNPIPINPLGCMKNDKDGILRNISSLPPDDARRSSCGSDLGACLEWPLTSSAIDYVYEFLQGHAVAAEILWRQGFDALSPNGDPQMDRVINAMYYHGWPATGDDEWLPALINAQFNRAYAGGSRAFGKGVGFTQYTHGTSIRTSTAPPRPSLCFDTLATTTSVPMTPATTYTSAYSPTDLPSASSSALGQSTTGGGAMTSTTGICAPLTVCPDFATLCGNIEDGCGGSVPCGGCNQTQCVNNVCTCIPATCRSEGYVCGNYSDGCGQEILSCGSCSGLETCIDGQCVPSGCGSPTDTCSSRDYDCGNFTTTCTGDGSPFVSNCGTCSSGYECIDNKCNCVSTVDICAVSNGPQPCGSLFDQCNRAVTCPKCNATGSICLSTGVCSGTVQCKEHEELIGGACKCKVGSDPTDCQPESVASVASKRIITTVRVPPLMACVATCWLSGRCHAF